ncbi:hypothetical protein ACFL0W_02780 [Nanoarchaeota archaeon]
MKKNSPILKLGKYIPVTINGEGNMDIEALRLEAKWEDILRPSFLYEATLSDGTTTTLASKKGFSPGQTIENAVLLYDPGNNNPILKPVNELSSLEADMLCLEVNSLYADLERLEEGLPTLLAGHLGYWTATDIERGALNYGGLIDVGSIGAINVLDNYKEKSVVGAKFVVGNYTGEPIIGKYPICIPKWFVALEKYKLSNGCTLFIVDNPSFHMGPNDSYNPLDRSTPPEILHPKPPIDMGMFNGVEN